MMRVFVDGTAFLVPHGATVHDAVRAFSASEAEDVAAGRRAVTDSRGLPIALDVPLSGAQTVLLRRCRSPQLLIPRSVRDRDRALTARAAEAGVTAISPAVIRRIPKAELHCHLDGSVRPATLLDLGRELGVPMPETSPDALAHHMYVRDARHLEDYLTRFDVTLAVMQGAGAIERIAFELGEDAAAEGVRYIEVRFAPVLNQRWGLSLDATVEAVLRGLGRAQAAHGIVGRVIVCGLRHLSPDISLELARLAVSISLEEA